MRLGDLVDAHDAKKGVHRLLLTFFTFLASPGGSVVAMIACVRVHEVMMGELVNQ